MRLRCLAWLLAALGVTGGGAAGAAPVSYTVDPTHTTVYFAASHFDRTTVRGRFGKIDGRIIYDPATGAGGIDFTVDTASVDTGNRSLDGVLRSAQFFDAANSPVARLRADRFVVENGKLVAVEGELTLLSTTRPLRLEADRFSCGEISLFGIRRKVCGGDFHATVTRSGFGMTRFLPEVGDNVTLQISVEAMPSDSVAP
ncbi:MULTISPECIES: YceI family protein [Cupriavidus]|uniref:YceI n=1 Tax=Cupriavidus pinatubonensis (strain JMP 134 / LMG 1197) TaxID=264198 RepID=Q474H4_CUPPJ|nr:MULTISPECIES: YceI family protein [Cupriavidus]TPQ40544.1 polyisoprenoid-binding protein [Cupriavidus pinatubonensis]